MGDREAVNANAFDDFCRAAIDFLAGADVPFLVIGGLAVAAVGEPRLTADIDVIAFVPMDAAERLIPSSAAAGFAAAEDEVGRLHATGTLRFQLDRFQLDIIVASLPFEERARRRAVSMRLFDRDVPMPTAEDLLLFKVISGREKDVLDAVGIVRRHGRRLDLAYVHAGVDEVCDLAEHTRPRDVLHEVLRKAAPERT